MHVIAEIKTTIIPDRVIFNGEVKKLQKIDEKFTINGYKLYLNDDDELLKLELNDPHPNCNPKTKEFCLSFNLIGREIDHTTMPVIVSLIKTFNLDDCYFQPWRDICFE